ncbi:MAG: hypothetical protein HON70_31575, partial [Lentisphaerae bacterium]|nr:hypothetical protein [Lentisphaerota bacterium]
GRVVVFGHDGYLASGALAKGDTAQLMVNALRWAARRPTQKLRIALLGVRGLTVLEGTADVTVVGGKWDIPEGEGRADVVMLHAVRVQDKAALGRVSAFVRSGGGLVVGATGWGWSQMNPGKQLEKDFRANDLLADAGIAFAHGMTKRPAGGELVPESSLSPALHAGKAIDLLTGTKTPDRRDLAQATDSVCEAARCVSARDRLFRPRLAALLDGVQERLVPTRKAPVGRKHGLARIAITLEAARIADLPPGKVTAHSAAVNFPGAVPDGASRTDVEFILDAAVPRWHSTGCYAAPGETIRIVVPERAVDKGLAVRIGAHKDKVWRRDAWWRYPEITRRFRVDGATTPAACAFGGLVYVEVPATCTLGVLPVTIRNVVRAPLYEHGKTELAEWRQSIRRRPGPWAELATRKVIITIPSENVRDLDTPDELMNFWDEVMDACADLATRPRERTSPEHYVADRQISVGYMHAGYPIMTFLDAAPRFVNLDRLRGRGDWGMFHEMGHNHQSGDWTFSGTGEVTVNLFSLYILATCCPGAPRHKAADPAAVSRLADEHLRSGADFSRWKSKPFTALAMYSQVVEAFGWEPLKAVLLSIGLCLRRSGLGTMMRRGTNGLLAWGRPWKETWGRSSRRGGCPCLEKPAGQLPIFLRGCRTASPGR